MKLVNWILGRKAQIIYILIALVFNTVAIYYLFFFSNNKIDLSNLFPSNSTVILAIEKPVIAVWEKFVFQSAKKTTPKAKGVPSLTPNITQQAEKNDLIDCVGPDGNHAWLTEGDCDKFNSAWKTATPSAQEDTKTATSDAKIN